MPAHRMDRDQFFASLGDRDADELAKMLWTLYWRGAAPMRERIEALLQPDVHARKTPEVVAVDPSAVLAEVENFAALARAGAYLAGDRRVSTKERSRWRFTFRRLVADALAGLHGASDSTAADAVAMLVDLACETSGLDYFRSEDPMQAASVVISDVVGQLWSSQRDRLPFAAFAAQSAEQLVRWEREYGWTRFGGGSIAEQETSLAEVLDRMLAAHDHWAGFAASYLDALDAVEQDDAAPVHTSTWSFDPVRERRERTRALARWHAVLIDRLVDSDADDLLDRLVLHPGLDGPEFAFVTARLAHARGDDDRARQLVHDCLKELPGHRGFHAFARDIDAPLPPRAQERV